MYILLSFFLSARTCHVRMVHVGASDFKLLIRAISHTIVVLVSSFLEEPLVSLGTVRCTWGGRHIISVALHLPISGLNGNLGVLIESPEGQNDNLVVEQGAEDEDDKAWDGLPLERFES